jgi:hypothetical protein
MSSTDTAASQLAAFVTRARSHGNDLAFLWLLLDGVGDDDAAVRLIVTLDAAEDDAVVQWTEFHRGSFPASALPG